MVIAPIVTAYVIYNERDKREMKNKASTIVCKQEIEHLIDIKNAPQSVRQEEIKEDIQRLERKLDKILDKLSGV